MKWFKTIATMLVAMPLPAAYAAPADPLIEGAKLCTQHLPRYEREYAIPTHLLSAIASIESGRYHEGLRMKLPWPWAINANGKGYFFDTKAEAIAAVQKLRKHGVQSIDVGCMQVNLYHHPEAFANLNEAFEPQKNIAYAANFLHNLYNEGGNWKKAASDYHSRTPSLGKEYVGQVYDSWYTIIEKLRAARLNMPEKSLVAMNEKSPAHVMHVASAETEKTYEHPHMNSVSVNTVPADDNAANQKIAANDRLTTNLIVMHSEPAPAPVFARTDKMLASPSTPPASAPVNTQVQMAAAQVAAPAPENKTENKTEIKTEIKTADTCAEPCGGSRYWPYHECWCPK